MKRSLKHSLLFASLLATSASSLKLEVERKVGAPLHPKRNYGGESELLYTLVGDFHDFLAGLTRGQSSGID
jgi:hypothetical protein